MTEIVDLSLTVTPGMRGVSMKSAHTVAENGWNAAHWNLYSHSGTHVDAPIHFEASPQTIDQMPLDLFCGRAWVATIPNVEPRQILAASDLGPLVDTLPAGACLLLHTDWSRHVEDTGIYRDKLPRIGEEFAHWLVEREVKLIGVEAPSVADVNDIDEVTRIHKILLGAGITIVEGLCNLHLLQPEVYFSAFPLKLANGDGCPARAVAWNASPSQIRL